MKQRNLEVHKKFHQGEQVFSCDMCEALFLKRYNLKIRVGSDTFLAGYFKSG